VAKKGRKKSVTKQVVRAAKSKFQRGRISSGSKTADRKAAKTNSGNWQNKNF